MPPAAQAQAAPVQPAPIPHAPALPMPRAPLAALPVRKAVSGCYGGALGAFRLELRVDVDRTRPMRRISGDLHQVIGKTTTYYGSFVVDNVTVTGTSQMVVRGLGRFTFAASAPVVQVTIPQVKLLQPQAATVQLFTATNALGASCHCPFTSLNFRSVRMETDCASDLHASMQKHFSLWSDLQQWCVWRMAARRYDGPAGIQGIMFDHLRHGFRNDVIMGGKNFAVGSSLGRDVMADPVSDESGLALTISTHRNNLALGEPVVLQLKSRATDTRGRRVHTWLHPDYGLVNAGARKTMATMPDPDGRPDKK